MKLFAIPTILFFAHVGPAMAHDPGASCNSCAPAVPIGGSPTCPETPCNDGEFCNVVPSQYGYCTWSCDATPWKNVCWYSNE